MLFDDEEPRHVPQAAEKTDDSTRRVLR